MLVGLQVVAALGIGVRAVPVAVDAEGVHRAGLLLLHSKSFEVCNARGGDGGGAVVLHVA